MELILYAEENVPS